MELFVENDVFRLLIALMHKHHTWFRAETHEAFVRFLNFAMARCGWGSSIFAFFCLLWTLCMLSLTLFSLFLGIIIHGVRLNGGSSCAAPFCSEAYITDPAEYIGTPEMKKQLVALNGTPARELFLLNQAMSARKMRLRLLPC